MKVTTNEKIKIKSNIKTLTVYNGLIDGLPVCLGYFPIAMAFGMLSKGAGLGLYESIAFSAIVFAGAAQFIGISMIALGVSPAEIIVTTLFLNFRHFLMSASLASKLKLKKPIAKLVIGFFVTDESFSVASFAKGKITAKYMLPMELLGYSGWVIGTGAGFLIGSILPDKVQLSMNIGLYAMFTALLVPEMKKTNKAIILAVLSGITNSMLRELLYMPEGWSIVVSIILVSILGVFMYNTSKESEETNVE